MGSQQVYCLIDNKRKRSRMDEHKAKFSFSNRKHDPLSSFQK